MINKNTFLPDYAVHPGEILLDVLSSIGMSQVELSSRTGITTKTISEIIKGKASITPETSQKLVYVLGLSASFWNNLERKYQEDLVRMREAEKRKEEIHFLKSLPLKAMIENKFIEKADNKLDQLRIVLEFFGIASINQLSSVWKEHGVTFREITSQSYNPMARAAWLRQGERLALKADLPDFDRNKLIDSLSKIRSNTTKTPEVFLPIITKLLNECGVSFFVVPDLPKTAIFGASKWIGKKPLIQIGCRYKYSDQFWFTIFHEIGHILKGSKKDLIIDDKIENEEKFADSFAANQLIPNNDYKDFVNNNKQISFDNIKKFANKITISPTIVIGRLQHDKIIPFNYLNAFKQKYEWDNLI